MTYVSQKTFETCLRRHLRGAKRLAVIGVGDELNVHDRLGMLAAREIDGLHLENVRVFYAGTVPETVTGPVRRYKPDAILLLDAADMGARPGTVACIEAGDIAARLLSTHSLPLSVVMDFLEKETHAHATLVGIQPDLSAQTFSPAGPEQSGLTRLLVSVFHILGGPQPRVAKRARKARRQSRAA